jgi:hypothetical protein
MTKLVTFIWLAAFPLAGMAVEQATGTESGPPGAGPPGYQSWPGQTTSNTELAPAKHVSAAAAHEQAAAHHKAAAAALQSGQSDQAKEHASAAEKASDEAGKISKEALASGQSK